MPAFVLACSAYLITALPASVIGLLWPLMRLSFHEPIGALGILLVFGIAASVVSSAATGRLLRRVRVGPVVAFSTLLPGVALEMEAFAPSLLVFVLGTVIFGIGFGALDSALNAHAASHFGARQINWMHACYGLGATVGPALVTALLSGGAGWRVIYGTMAAAPVILAVVFALSRRSWEGERRGSADAGSGRARRAPVAGAPAGRSLGWAVLPVLAFAAVETGIESVPGIWGYVFLVDGRGLPHGVAGLAVSAYAAMMFAGRAVLGPVAERFGPGRVLAWAVAAVPLGAALMAVPGPGWLPVTGMMTVGLATAPVFPLLTLTTAQRLGDRGAARTAQTVGLQVAAGSVGSAALPVGTGLAIGAFGARSVGPLILALALAMWGVYRLVSRAGEWAACRFDEGR